MLKLLVGVGLGVLLWSTPQAKRITAQVLRGTADYLDPQQKRTNSQEIKLEAPPPPLPKN